MALPILGVGLPFGKLGGTRWVGAKLLLAVLLDEEAVSDDSFFSIAQSYPSPAFVMVIVTLIQRNTTILNTHKGKWLMDVQQPWQHTTTKRDVDCYHRTTTVLCYGSSCTI